MSMKNLMTPSGIEPATFQLVAQCLKQLRVVERVKKKGRRNSNVTRQQMVLSVT